MARATIPVQAIYLYLSLVIHLVTGQISQLYSFYMSCNEDQNFSFLRAVPWSCQQYLMCVSGMSLPGSCPNGQVFRESSLTCEWPSARDLPRCRDTILRSMSSTCLQRPSAKMASPVVCSQYFRCQPQTHPNGNTEVNNKPSFEMEECPYPYLFSQETESCQRFDRVNCHGKPVPKAPCDYVQYQKLCDSPDCPSCNTRHPSCVGLANGFQALSGQPLYYLVCFEERTLDVRRCEKDHVFSQVLKSCVRS